MKNNRIVPFLTALLLSLCLLLSSAGAEELVSAIYTDATIALTQDYVQSIEATAGCSIQTLPPDEQTVALLHDIYDFVWKQGNRPVQYFDEATRQEIQALVGDMDINQLFLAELMQMQLAGDPTETVKVQIRMDVDYRVGQLVVLVFGVMQEDGSYAWHPYLGKVPETGVIAFEVPAEDWKMLSEQSVILCGLSDRMNGRKEFELHEKTETDRQQIFSKDAGDVTHTIRWYTEKNVPIADDFIFRLVDLTDPMQIEQMLIGMHMAAGNSALSWFPEERQEEVRLMLSPETDPKDLIPYDVIAAEVEEYVDAYGDVTVEIIFGTSYQPEKDMIVLCGLPVMKPDGGYEMDWYVLRAEALGGKDGVEIGVKQLNMQQMMEAPMMLVVISENLTAEAQPDAAE